MAACIDNSTNHALFQIAADHSPHCHLTNSFSKLITRLRPSKFKSSCRIIPEDEEEEEEQAIHEDNTWLKIRQEAERDIKQEPILEKYYNSIILSHNSLESALAYQLSTKLCSGDLSRESLYSVFLKALSENRGIQVAIRDDLKAVKERDPACISHVHCFLNFKGFLAGQAYRLAHHFWAEGRNGLAFLIQSRVSEVFGMDIHPAAKMGHGIVFDHGTGVVIGETAVVGNNVTILHDVTLGGTGKVEGDRHPKIGDGVFIGAGVKVLGNIKVGENAKIGAGSVVLKEVPAGATAVGNPARIIGIRSNI